MEVHSHTPHTENKTWKTHMWEFLMLFLAVFCGFTTENIREHKVEHERAVVLAKNLYKETLADSVIIEQMMATREIKEKESAYFIAYVKDSSRINEGKHGLVATKFSLS